MSQFETQKEHVFFNAPPWVWISRHLVDKCSVIRSTICRDGPCDGDSDKCCGGDHLLSEGYRNTEESQSVLRNLLRISFSNFISIEASLSLGLTHRHRIAEWKTTSFTNVTMLTTTSSLEIFCLKIMNCCWIWLFNLGTDCCVSSAVFFICLTQTGWISANASVTSDLNLNLKLRLPSSTQ